MEVNFEQQLEEVTKTEGVVGCLITDQSGLCLGVRGEASSDSAGVITALNNLAKSLEPTSKPPTICLKSDTRQCIIQQQDSIIGVIYKNTSP